MRAISRGRWIVALILPMLAGCIQNPALQQDQARRLRQQQTALDYEYQQLKRDRQELESLVQEQRNSEVLKEQLSAVRGQLRSTLDKLAQARGQKSSFASHPTRQRDDLASQRIATNISPTEALPTFHAPGVHVRRDGDVIRIELASGELFENGTDRLRPGADKTIENAATEIVRTHPRKTIGVEGHTDNDPAGGHHVSDHLRLSISQAMAVYNHLVAHTQLKPGQLFLTGHGGNHPVVSNGTPAGKQRNRRIELVIYPHEPLRQ